MVGRWVVTWMFSVRFKLGARKGSGHFHCISNIVTLNYPFFRFHPVRLIGIFDKIGLLI